MDKDGNFFWKVVITVVVLALNLTACDNGKPIPKGSLDDVMRDEASFYTIRGGSDYSRLPLRYPFHIVDTTRSPDFCKGRVVLVENVSAINVQSNFIFGRFSGGLIFGSRRDAGWFAVNVLTESNNFFGNESGLSQFLYGAGITNSAVGEVQPAMKKFMFSGELAFPR